MFVQVLSPNKYVGWGIIFVWFVGTIFLNNMGYSNPLYSYGQDPDVPLSDFVGAGSFWIGAAIFQFYWLCFAVILAVIAHCSGRAAPISASESASSDCLATRPSRRWPSPARRPPQWPLTGVYAYHNIKQLNRYRDVRRRREIQRGL